MLTKDINYDSVSIVLLINIYNKTERYKANQNFYLILFIHLNISEIYLSNKHQETLDIFYGKQPLVGFKSA